jgi:molecular chaperone HtpG
MIGTNRDQLNFFSEEEIFDFGDLLFAPRRAPSDLFEQKKKLSHIRFYCLRVFVLNR